MHPGTLDVSAKLLKQFLDWIASQPRTYAETMEAWRTSCPRISVWEDALLGQFVTMEAEPGRPRAEAKVILTQAGVDHLTERR